MLWQIKRTESCRSIHRRWNFINNRANIEIFSLHHFVKLALHINHATECIWVTERTCRVVYYIIDGDSCGHFWTIVAQQLMWYVQWLKRNSDKWQKIINYSKVSGKIKPKLWQVGFAFLLQTIRINHSIFSKWDCISRWYTVKGSQHSIAQGAGTIALTWPWQLEAMWRFSRGSLLTVDYPLCRMSQSVVRTGRHAVIGDHYISVGDLFSHGGKKQFLLKHFWALRGFFCGWETGRRRSKHFYRRLSTSSTLAVWYFVLEAQL